MNWWTEGAECCRTRRRLSKTIGLCPDGAGSVLAVTFFIMCVCVLVLNTEYEIETDVETIEPEFSCLHFTP